MKNELYLRILSSIVLLPIIFFLILKGSTYFNCLLIICLVISFYEWHSISYKKSYYLPGLIIISLSFYSFSYIYGKMYYFLLVIMTCIFTDIGGYIFGKIFGGPKLTKISPNKTYTGMIGGYLLSLICVCLINEKILIEFNFNNYQNINLFIIFFLLIISTSSQIGDIFVSYFKRLAKVKNTGKIIPGHGGLLDRIDGMIFAFPICFIILKILK